MVLSTSANLFRRLKPRPLNLFGFSGFCTSRSIPMGSQCSIIVDATLRPHAKIQINSAWQDFIDVKETISAGDGATELPARHQSYSVEVDAEDNLCYISTQGYFEEKNMDSTLVLTVPELCDTVHVAGNNVELVIRNKLQTNTFAVGCNSGSVLIEGKVRGMNVEMDCGTAEVTSSKALEGNSLHIKSCAGFTGKLVHADRLFVTSTGDVNMSSLYCKTADIQTGAGGIAVDQSHGLLRAFSAKGDILVGASNGYLNLRTQFGSSVSFHIQQMPPAQERASVVSAPCGSIRASIDKQVEGQMTLVGVTPVGDDDAVVKLPASEFSVLKEFGADEVSSLLKDLPVDPGEDWYGSGAWHLENHGQVEDGSRTVDSMVQSGKINSYSAQKQSMDRFVSTGDDTDGTALAHAHPVVVCLAKNVHITSDSWKDRITRKYNQNPNLQTQLNLSSKRKNSKIFPRGADVCVSNNDPLK